MAVSVKYKRTYVIVIFVLCVQRRGFRDYITLSFLKQFILYNLSLTGHCLKLTTDFIAVNQL